MSAISPSGISPPQAILGAGFDREANTFISTVITPEQWANAATLELPSYPRELKDFLEGDCTIWPGKKRKDTHIVVPLFPEVNLNGAPEPLTPETLDQLDKSSGGPGYQGFWPKIPKNIPSDPEFHYGVMTKDVLPGSRNQSYEKQTELLPKGYEVPGALDAARALLWEQQRSGIRYCSDDPWTYTRCKEEGEGWNSIVGGLATYGLRIISGFHGSVNDESIGVVGWRKFRLS